MTHHKTLSAKYLIVTCSCLLETRGIFWSLKWPKKLLFFSLHIFDKEYTSMQRRSADIALQTPLQKRLTSTLNDVLYWKEEGGEIFHALIVWFWDFLGTQWGDIFFQKAFLFLWLSHWEKLLQSVSDFIFSKHYGCTPGVSGVS